MVLKTLLLGSAMALLATVASADSVQNGGFTTGDFTDWTTHTCSIGCAVQGWGVGTFPSDPGTLPTGTTFAAETACVGTGCNNPTTGDWISQALPTVPLQTYTLSFFYDPGPGSGTIGTTELSVLWNGSLVPGGTIIDATASTWATYTFTGLVATSSSTALEFTGRQDPSVLFLTDISVNGATSTVPEPTSLLLMGSGLLGIGLLRLRREA